MVISERFGKKRGKKCGQKYPEFLKIEPYFTNTIDIAKRQTRQRLPAQSPHGSPSQVRSYLGGARQKNDPLQT